MSIDSIKSNINIIKENLYRVEETNFDEQSIRELLSQEYEAVKSYEELALKAQHPLTKKVFLSISREELLHIGELERLLEKINMSSKKEYEEGAKEVDDAEKSLNESFPFNNPYSYFESMYQELYSTYKKNPSSYNKGRMEQANNIMNFLLGQRAKTVINKVETNYASNKYK